MKSQRMEDKDETWGESEGTKKWNGIATGLWRGGGGLVGTFLHFTARGHQKCEKEDKTNKLADFKNSQIFFWNFTNYLKLTNNLLVEIIF